MREGRFSLDQVGVIAKRAPEGSDEHFANLAASATVNQLSTALKLQPPPEPEPDPEADDDDDDEDEAPPPRPEPPRSFSKTSDEQSTTYRLTLPHEEAAIFDAAVDSHRDALITDWKRDHDADDDRDTDGYADPDKDAVSEQAPPFPNTVDAVMSVVRAGWDADVARRPHGQHTTVVVHVDLESRVAALHLGPLLHELRPPIPDL